MNNYLNYERLAHAIILQAAKDWRAAVRTIRYHPFTRAAYDVQYECELFFLSSWFAELTKVDGAYILKKLREEAGLRCW